MKDRMKLGMSYLRLRKKMGAVQIMALGFFLMILIGGIVLSLPICNADGKFLPFVDALFTAGTATCVTGLMTVVPATQFTLLGKIVLFFLIQAGGLGIIVCGMGIFLLLKRKITVRERSMIQSQFDTDSLEGMVRMVRRVIFGTFLVEGIGAVGYMFVLIPEYGFVKGCFYGIFHSVSAFCNAGIDLLGDNSLANYIHNPWINIVTMFMIILGGIGFFIWDDIRTLISNLIHKRYPVKKCFHRVTLHSKLTLAMTGILIFGGAAVYYLLEGNNPQTLGALSGVDKAIAALFQSVTTRTAGFFTISQPDLKDVSKFWGCVLMFVGGSPGGTAGGVKTTTVAMMALTCIAIVKGKPSTTCFGRSVTDSSIRSGISVLVLGTVFSLTGTILVAALEPSASIIDVMYEVYSAVATVGLTAGLTPTLCTASKYVIIILMYFGRLGPVTIALLLLTKNDGKGDGIKLPSSKIFVG